MNLVFGLDDVICTPAKGIHFGIPDYVEHCVPIEDTVEFMLWAKKKGHHITIWCDRPNDLGVKLATEQWLKLAQVPYDRLLFDRPENYIDINEAPSHAKFYKHEQDMSIVAEMYEQWKYDKTREDKREEAEH